MLLHLHLHQSLWLDPTEFEPLVEKTKERDTQHSHKLS